MIVRWFIDFVIEPNGREVSMEIEATTSRAAMIEALNRLDLQPGELLHSLFAHISRPEEISS